MRKHAKKNMRIAVAVIMTVMMSVSCFAPVCTSFAEENAEQEATTMKVSTSKEQTQDKDNRQEQEKENKSVSEPAESDEESDTSDVNEDTTVPTSTEARSKEEEKGFGDPDGINDSEDADETMPARFFSGSAGGIDVKAMAGKGIFPEGTKMKVSPVSSSFVLSAANTAVGEDIDVVDAAAVDITFTHDGREIQPADGSVSVSLDSRSIEGDVHEAVHITAGGSAQIIGDASSGSAKFKASHFSIYGIIGGNYVSGAEEEARYTYEFYNGATKVDTQILHNGDKLHRPATPASSTGNAFKGWYVESTDKEVAFDTPITISNTEKEDRTIKVVAKFSQIYRVNFWKDKVNGTLVNMKEAEAGTSVTTRDVRLALENGEAIIGWKQDEEEVASVLVNDADIDLLPVVSQAHQITFETGEGSSVAPAFVQTGQKLTQPGEPTRSGWDFAGWYRDAGYKTEYDFKDDVNSDFTLYGKWISGSKVGYKVLHWLQNAEDDSYTLKDTETRTDYAGNTAVFTTKTYEGFTLNETASNVVVVIKGDGTTIKNVYYDRNKYPLTFYLQEDVVVPDGTSKTTIKNGFASRTEAERYMDSLDASQYPGLRVESYTTGILWWQETYYRIVWDKPRYKTVKQWVAKETQFFRYGQDTSKFWDEVDKKYADQLWYTTERNAENDGTAWSHAPAMGTSATAAYGKKSNQTGTMYYKEYGTTTDIKAPYQVRRSNWEFTIEDYIHIPGFTFKESKKQNKATGTIYYTRNKYSLQMDPRDGTGLITKSGIAYEAALAGYRPDQYVVGTTKHTFNGIEKTFAGWYDNADCVGTPFDFNSRMPGLDPNGASLMLYGKWTAGKYTVSFDLDGGTIDGANAIASETVEAGNLADQPVGEMKKNGFEFGGWQDQDGNRFSFQTKITRDYELKPIWTSKSTAELKVAYDAGDKGTFTGVDNRKYVSGVGAVILGVPTVKPEMAAKGWQFVGWKVADSSALVTHGSFIVQETDAVNGVVTLTAQYDQRFETTTLTYKSNGGVGNDKVLNDLKINEDHVLLTESAAGFTLEGHDFLGWHTSSTATAPLYKAGEKVAVDKLGGTLYAVWALSKTQVDVVIYGNTAKYTYDGTEKTLTPSKEPDYSVFKAGTEEPLDKDLVIVEMAEGEDENYSIKKKDAGTYPLGLPATNEYGVYDVGVNAEIDKNIEINEERIVDGHLTINPAPITIKTGSALKEYDSQPLTTEEVEITGLVNNETVTVKATGTITDVGSTENTYTIDWGTTNKDNYIITETLGILTIEPATIVQPTDEEPTEEATVKGITENKSAQVKGASKNRDEGSENIDGTAETGDSHRSGLLIALWMMLMATALTIVVVAGWRRQTER